MTPIALVLSKIDGARKQGRKGYTAKCPAHDDKEASLGISEADDGRVLLKCYAGCETELVLKAIGLELRDLFPDRKTSDRKQGKKGNWGQIVKEYWYTDENGVNAHQTVRFEPKSFKQRHWSPITNMWSWSLLGVKTYLYHLPQLLQGIQEGREVWLPEGEKDAEAFEKQGELATTNPMGAINWKPEYTEWLAGARVTIVRDPDKAGYKRCAFLFKELTAAGCHVRAVQAAIHKGADGNWVIKDAYDHFAAKLTLNDFQVVDPLEKWREPKPAAVEPTEEPEPADAKVRETARAAVVPPSDGSKEIELPWEPGRSKFKRTDLGNAERLVALFGKDLRWCPELGCWLEWNGNVWHVDRTEGASAQAKAVATIRSMYREANELEFGSDDRKDLFNHAVKSESRGAIDAMIALAKKQPGMPVLFDDLDADDYLAGCSNGTLDLFSGELREARREDLITKQLGFPYDPDAKCDDFRKFLSECLKGDKELYAYVWRFMGYTLTGSVREEIFAFAHGPGGGGKGTLFHVLATVLGDYATTLRGQSLMATTMDAIPQDIAKLKGCRAAFVHETSENRRFNEELIKELTGNNEITARFMRENEFSFFPKFKLWIAGNHKPKIISFDRAMERRLRLLPFEHIVPDDKIDRGLKERLARTDGPGVLRDMVKWCVKWHRDGLQTPEAVKSAINEYKEESDAVLRFIAECCDVDEFGEATKARALYQAYRRWAKMTDDYCSTETWFGRLLTLKGYKKKRQMDGLYYEGLALKEPEQSTTDEEPRWRD